MDERFGTWIRTLGIEPDARMLSRFRTYFDYLTERNAVMNLTAITAEAEVYRKHFFDSLALVKAGPVAGLSLLDVGAGAGFPSLPLKIVFPTLRVTIVDALAKRIGFLNELLTRLGIADVETIHGRAEDLDRRNAFDLVTARAVARLNVLAELCVPFVRVGGRFIAMKAGDCDAEVAEAASAFATLGARLEGVLSYDLEPGQTHALVLVGKTAPTPSKYPRSFAQIKNKPL